MLGPAPASPRTSGQSHGGGRASEKKGEEEGCFPERCGERPRVTLTWRQLRECSRPGLGPPAPAPAGTLDFCSSRCPRPSFRRPSPSPRPASSPPLPRPGHPGFPARPRRPSPRPGRPNSLFPESSRPPLPHSQTLALFPESSALAAPARPPPLPRAARGRGRGLRPGPAPASRAPMFPGGRPGPCGPPPGNPGVPNSRLWGLGEAARQNPAPGDLTP